MRTDSDVDLLIEFEAGHRAARRVSKTTQQFIHLIREAETSRCVKSNTKR
jgi:predicted nucleotidyltransferase